MFGPRIACALVLLVASPAIAAQPEPAAAQPATDTSEPAEEEQTPLIPAAKDQLSGHLLLGASGLGLLPIAMLDGKTSFMDRAGLGVGAAGDLGIGVSRNVVFGIFGEYARFTSSSDCSSCDTDTLAVGPFVRYHVVQGTRFDPWLMLGVGYRRLTASGGPKEADYRGIDWARLALGGDWYALSQVGFGPYAEVTLGTFTDRPSGTSATVYGMVNLGVRLAFDLQGR
ncbi:MAG TPA: hypothetical protein VFQ35_07575 [Polyangiaceae bacterium]|nr:hypothetical protein [Polyangiaceae bacterium]